MIPWMLSLPTEQHPAGQRDTLPCEKGRLRFNDCTFRQPWQPVLETERAPGFIPGRTLSEAQWSESGEGFQKVC